MPSLQMDLITRSDLILNGCHPAGYWTIAASTAQIVGRPLLAIYVVITIPRAATLKAPGTVDPVATRGL